MNNKSVWAVIIIVVIVLVGGGLLLANKNSDNTTPSTTTTSNNGNTEDMNNNDNSSASTTPTATDKVDIKDMAFSPADITVAVGTTVTWTNNDDDAHTVAAKDDSFHSGSLAKGQSFRYTFTKAGTYDYLCSIHPFMVASVTVTQ